MKPIEFIGWLVVTGGVSFLNFVTEPALDLKLIGGPEEPLLRGIAPGMVVVSSFLAFMLSREKPPELVYKRVICTIWVSGVSLLIALFIKSFIDQWVLEETWTRLLWFTRYILLLTYLIALGVSIGAVWNTSKNVN